MDIIDAHTPLFPIEVDFKPTIVTKTGIILGNLIILGQVGIVIILPVETGILGDAAVQGDSGAYGVFEGGLIQDGQDAGHPQANGADLGIGRGAKGGGASAKDFGFRFQLGMDFHAHDRFIFHQSSPSSKWRFSFVVLGALLIGISRG
jgi:hypothetical protein